MKRVSAESIKQDARIMQERNDFRPSSYIKS